LQTHCEASELPGFEVWFTGQAAQVISASGLLL